jgi:hypothetical protein
MRKTCAQLVRTVDISGHRLIHLPTDQTVGTMSTAHNPRVYPARVHKFLMQFCATKVHKITEVTDKISTLSTALIIETKWVYKEKELLGTGG